AGRGGNFGRRLGRGTERLGGGGAPTGRGGIARGGGACRAGVAAVSVFRGGGFRCTGAATPSIVVESCAAGRAEFDRASGSAGSSPGLWTTNDARHFGQRMLTPVVGTR